MSKDVVSTRLQSSPPYKGYLCHTALPKIQGSPGSRNIMSIQGASAKDDLKETFFFPQQNSAVAYMKS